jgi:hypothetical protein
MPSHWEAAWGAPARRVRLWQSRPTTGDPELFVRWLPVVGRDCHGAVAPRNDASFAGLPRRFAPRNASSFCRIAALRDDCTRGRSHGERSGAE